MNPELQKEVKDAVNAAEAGGTSNPAENVPSSQEVKESANEPSKEPVKEAQPAGKDPVKLEEQINNLNVALKTEREQSKAKLSEMEAKLQESSKILERFKGVFVPDEPKEPTPEPKYLTPDEVKEMVAKELAAKKEEETQNQKIAEMKNEIKALESEFDGKEGKPLYNDEEVLEWQRKNDKAYLSPRDAFYQMKHNEILDYEVKQRLADVKPAINVEKGSSAPGDNQPGGSNLNADTNTRDAIRQAMEEAEKEM